jgi:hypothetical protein
MADLLTHVLVAYAILTVASWRIAWLDDRWVAVAVVGSVLPDLNRIDLLLPDETVTAVTGVPFDWGGIHTLGGVLLMAGLGALLFDRECGYVRPFALLCAGALSHVVVDIPQRYADGETLTNLYFFPFSSWRVTTPGWYVTADRWVVVVAFGIALAVFIVDRRLSTN